MPRGQGGDRASGKEAEIARKARTYFTRAEAAQLFEVAPNTISRWARDGKLPFIETPGGRRRYPMEFTLALARKLNGFG
jgi:excisionase family DNA binding protein